MLGTEWHVVELFCCDLIFQILPLIVLVSASLTMVKLDINSLYDIHKVGFDTNDSLIVKIKKERGTYSLMRDVNRVRILLRVTFTNISNCHK
jgi:hypothetical protein